MKERTLQIAILIALAGCGASELPEPVHTFTQAGGITYRCTPPASRGFARWRGPDFINQVPRELVALKEQTAWVTDATGPDRVIVLDDNGDKRSVGFALSNATASSLNITGSSGFVWKESFPDGSQALVRYHLGRDRKLNTADDRGPILLDPDVEDDTHIVSNGAILSWTKPTHGTISWCQLDVSDDIGSNCSAARHETSPIIPGLEDGLVAFSTVSGRTMALARVVDQPVLQVARTDDFVWVPYASEIEDQTLGDISINRFHIFGSQSGSSYEISLGVFSTQPDTRNQVVPLTPTLDGALRGDVTVSKDIISLVFDPFNPSNVAWFDDNGFLNVTEARAPEPFSLAIASVSPNADRGVWIWDDRVLYYTEGENGDLEFFETQCTYAVSESQ